MCWYLVIEYTYSEIVFQAMNIENIEQNFERNWFVSEVKILLIL